MPSTVATNKQLTNRLPVTTDTQLLYQVQGISMTTYVRMLIVCNTTSVAKTYSIWVNQTGQNVADQYAIRKSIPLAANASDMIIFPGDTALILNGDQNHGSASIICQASAASAIAFHLFGTEVIAI